MRREERPPSLRRPGCVPERADGRGRDCRGARCSQFLGLLERQAAFAVEELAKTAVTGTVGAADDFRRDAVARFAASAAALEPVFPANGPALGNRRDWVFGVHLPLRQPVVPVRKAYGIRVARQAGGLPANPPPRGRRGQRR